MNELTQRQIEILKSLIEEYINTAEPVGSETLEKKHNLTASPATIRNEMVRLTNLGYLKKPHVSAGRIPTPQAMKFYVNQLMKEKNLSVTEEVNVKEKVWDLREQEERFLKELTKNLAEKTKALAITATDEGDFFVCGFANLLDMPEFYDIDITKNLFSVIDEFDYFSRIFSNTQDQDIRVLVGEELGPRLNGPYGFVYRKFSSPNGKINGDIGVLGPNRLNYTSVVPTVRYFGDLIEEIANW